MDPRTSIVRQVAPFVWDGIARQEYKSADQHWQGVERTEIVAEPSRAELNFHVRYFSIEPGGFSSREKHGHEHVVIVAHGEGTVEIDGTVSTIRAGDIVHVRSWQMHQFVGSGSGMGFYCIVPADRDRPIVDGGGPSVCEIPVSKTPRD